MSLDALITGAAGIFAVILLSIASTIVLASGMELVSRLLPNTRWEKRDRRIIELLNANNAEVERRRQAEAQLRAIAGLVHTVEPKLPNGHEYDFLELPDYVEAMVNRLRKTERERDEAKAHHVRWVNDVDADLAQIEEGLDRQDAECADELASLRAKVRDYVDTVKAIAVKGLGWPDPGPKPETNPWPPGLISDHVAALRARADAAEAAVGVLREALEAARQHLTLAFTRDDRIAGRLFQGIEAVLTSTAEAAAARDAEQTKTLADQWMQCANEWRDMLIKSEVQTDLLRKVLRRVLDGVENFEDMEGLRAAEDAFAKTDPAKIPDDEPVRLPQAGDPRPGELWRHHSGRVYGVLMLTNTAHPSRKFPPTVVYVNTEAKTEWSRPLSDWHRSFTLLEGVADA